MSQTLTSAANRDFEGQLGRSDKEDYFILPKVIIHQNLTTFLNIHEATANFVKLVVLNQSQNFSLKNKSSDFCFTLSSSGR